MEPVESETNMFQSALEAVDQKDKDRARDLFTRLIKQNPNKAEYWVWLSSLVPTTKEKTYCLQEALRIDPKNNAARRGLSMQGVLPPDDKKIISLKHQRRNWASTFHSPGLMEKLFLIPNWAQMASAATVVIGLLVIGWIVYFSTPGLGAPDRSRVYGTPFDTLSPGQLQTSTVMALKPKITATFLGATPLASLLRVTYTPTPSYINTPHPNSEAYNAAISAYNRKDGVKMLDYIRQALDNEPDSADLNYYLGEAFRLNGDYSGAINAYKSALQLDPYFAPAYLGRGRATLAGFPRSWKDAKGDMIRATEIDPNLTEAYFDIADVTMQKNLDPVSAIKYLDIAYKQKADSPLVHYYYAKAYLMMEDAPKAVEEAQMAIDLDITLLDAYRVLGEASVSINQPAEALNQLSFYTIYRPEDTEALSWLALAYRQLGNNEKALEIFNQVIDLDSHQFMPYLYRGIIYLEKDQPRLARSDLEEALSLNKNSYDVNFYLGRVLLSLEEAGNAYMKFSAAEGLAKNDPQLAKVYYWRAQSLQVLEKSSSSYESVEVKDLKALLNLPQDSVEPNWAVTARQRLLELTGIGPTIPPASIPSQQPTRTKSATPTRTPTRTSTATPTPTASLTPSPTKTPSPTSTPTSTGVANP